MASKYSKEYSKEIECIDTVLSLVLNKLNLGISSLSASQSEAFKAFIMETDTFVSLPTGHGKSLIYQIAVPVVKELVRTYPDEFITRRFPSHPMLLVVSPLNSLINDQMGSCKQFGLKVARLDELLLHHDHDDIDILFTGPETLEKNYEVVSVFAKRMLGVVVDETHCVITW